MKASDTNEGTPLGYAVPGQDNEFLIYSYNSFLLFVGGIYRSVKIPDRNTRCEVKNVYIYDISVL